MKKIITPILLLISIILFGQNKEYSDAVNLYNSKQYKEANVIIERLLNKEFGDLNEEKEYYCLQMSMNVYVMFNDYKSAFYKAERYLDFASNSSKKFFANKEKAISGAKEYLEKLKLKLPVEDKISRQETGNTNSNDVTKVDTNNSNFSSENKPVSDDKTVTLTVSGTGKTLEEARLNALRSAIEQAFGAFISSKTEILNDKLIKDEIVSVASGNVEKYDVVSQIEIPNNSFAITLNATVSISKLTSFAESKGVVVEFKGGVFGLNMKLQKLNEKNELKSAVEILGIVHETLQNSFDYKINVSDSPQFVNENLYKLPISVSVYSNDNYEKIIMFLIKSLRAFSMDSVEIENYKKINKKVYEINFYLDDKYGYKYYLRNEYSFQTISNIFKSWEFYLGNYKVSNNVNTIYGPDQNTELNWNMSHRPEDPSILQIPFANKTIPTYDHEVVYENGKKTFTRIEYRCDNYVKDYYKSGGDYYNSDTQVFFTFPWTKDKIVIFSWDQPYKLNEIEKLTNFEVKSKGIVSQFSDGGYLLNEINGEKIIAAPYEINNIDGELVVNNIGNLLWTSNNLTNDSFGTSIENTAIFAQAGEKTIGAMMNKFNKSQSTNWSIPSAKESLLMYIKLKKIGVLNFYQYKYYLSSSLPKEDTTNEFIYVISEDSNPTEELYSDFINNLKIPLYDFINKNYKNYLSKCRDGQKVIIKPIRYIKN